MPNWREQELQCLWKVWQQQHTAQQHHRFQLEHSSGKSAYKILCYESTQSKSNFYLGRPFSCLDIPAPCEYWLELLSAEDYRDLSKSYLTFYHIVKSRASAPLCQQDQLLIFLFSHSYHAFFIFMHISWFPRWLFHHLHLSVLQLGKRGRMKGKNVNAR